MEWIRQVEIPLKLLSFDEYSQVDVQTFYENQVWTSTCGYSSKLIQINYLLKPLYFKKYMQYPKHDILSKFNHN